MPTLSLRFGSALIWAADCCPNWRSGQCSTKNFMYLRLRKESPFMYGKAARRSTVLAFIHREIQPFFKTRLQRRLASRPIGSLIGGGSGNDHNDRHRSNDSSQRAGFAAQPEAGKLPDRGGMAGSRLRLEPPGGLVCYADDAAMERIPRAVKNKRNGVRAVCACWPLPD
jgi:hypothetical protein